MKHRLACDRKLLRRLLQLLVWCGAFHAALPLLAADAGEAKPKGLYVRNGVLMREGRAYHGIGANYNTLFSRLLKDKGDTSSLKNLALLGKAGIPFVRYAACGYWPEGQKLYLDDRAEFFRRMDLVVRSAEQNGVGLIPSFFWRLATVQELVGEEAAQLGNVNSKSNQLIREFARDMVLRYRDSPAIWGWEFGNEANLAIDLPKAGARRGQGGANFGSAKWLSGDVRLTSHQLHIAYTSFAETVRKLDPSRPIDPGTAMPRTSAWHNARGQFWQRDSVGQSLSTLSSVTPAPMNMISVHVYEAAPQHFPGSANGVAGVIALLMRTAAEAHKPLFIGEFPTRNRAQAEEFLRAIQDNRVPLSAFWAFDNKAQASTMSVDFQNQRSFVLDLVAKANRALQINN